MTSGIDPDDLAEVLQEAMRLVAKKKKQPKKDDKRRTKKIPQFDSLEGWEKHYRNARRVCPHCLTSKLTVKDFGARPIRGIYYVHSWCRECRATTNYNARPRKYHTRNS